MEFFLLVHWDVEEGLGFRPVLVYPYSHVVSTTSDFMIDHRVFDNVIELLLMNLLEDVTLSHSLSLIIFNDLCEMSINRFLKD